MRNSVRSRAAFLALATSLMFGGAAVTSAASARSMPREPVPVVASVPPFGSFAGGGRGWTIDIRAHRDGVHTVRMRLRDGSDWRGTIRYPGRVMDMPSNFIVMSGELRNGLAMLPITVEINPDRICRETGRRIRGSVSVHGAQHEPLRGCGTAGRFGRYR